MIVPDPTAPVLVVDTLVPYVVSVPVCTTPVSVTLKNAPYSVSAVISVDEKSKSRSASGLVSLMPTLPSFFTNNSEVEAELMMLNALPVEIAVDPAIVVLANNPVLVPMPTLLAVEINNVEVAVRVVPFAA